jgi:pre-mRNA branch site protein p14
MSTTTERKPVRLAPEVNKIIFVRNLPYKITSEEMYDVFGRFGPIRQIRKGKTGDKKGTAFIVYEDIFDAKEAVDNLNGFNVGGRYLVALYYSAKRVQQIREMSKE